MVRQVRTADDVRVLVAELLHPSRRRPLCLASIPVGKSEPRVDLARFLDEVGDVCELVTIATGPLTYALEDAMPDGCGVYGGAARVYPVGTAWQRELELSPLRFGGSSTTARIIEDALRMAEAAGLFRRPPSVRPQVSGEVRMLLAGGAAAMVRLDSGEPSTIPQESLPNGLRLEQVVAVGQRVTGLWDAASRQLQLELRTPTGAELESAFPHACVTPALVTASSPHAATLALHPQHALRIARADVTSNPLDRLDLLLEVGDVVLARVLHEDGALRLRLLDVDDDEAVVPSLALLEGGPQWLQVPALAEPPREAGPQGEDLDEALPDEDEDVADEAVAPAAVSETVQAQGRGALQSALLALEQARARIAALELELRASRASAPEEAAAVELEVSRLQRENARLIEDAAKLRRDGAVLRKIARSARTTTGESPRSRRARFGDAAAWVCHELYLAWIERYEPGDREEWELPTGYGIGPDFAASLDALEDDRLEKAFKATVDVLTGRARFVPGREVHPLRTSDTPNASDLVRADGARCMRCYIEQKTPSARRLHYWVLRDGTVELSRVVLHDDMRP